ncbi:MAG TPA: isochorismatase family protein [Kofleriaceae bacterium]|jgi:nicotinamidase-related amidase|nr:isochorismatase family protein [Kofleriaceae bacterium]
MSSNRRALLVIDMQNDFLDERGAFAKRHRDARELAETLGWVVRAARQQGDLIAWITSTYGVAAGAPESLRGQTHTGGPCCVAGSWGAALYGPVAQLPEAHDGRIDKHWYSAFRDTELHARLQAAGAHELLLAGVATNVGVLATAKDAHRLGHTVTVLADVTTAGTLGKHERALHDLAAAGIPSRSWADVLGAGRFELGGLGEGTTLVCGALDGCVDATTFDALEAEVAWSAMHHRGGVVPRLVALQGDLQPDGALPLYRHPADEQPALRPWTPAVDRIRRAVEAHVGHPMNHALIQLYRHGKDWISEHSDKTLDLVRPSFIVNVSLGQRRTMILRPKRKDGEDAIQRIPLVHGSLLRMDLETNRRWFHSIKQEADRQPRISLTLRHIGTWWDPSTGAVWGVGAPSASRAEAEARARARAPRSQAQADLEDRAEAEQMLRLFRDENVDPSFDAAAYRPGFEVRDLQLLSGIP